MLTKAGKFKFNAETALRSPSLCVGAGGGKESLQNQPTMVSSCGQPRRANRGLISLGSRVFGDFTYQVTEMELGFVPLFQGCEKGNDVYIIREQSSVGEKKCILKDFV